MSLLSLSQKELSEGRTLTPQSHNQHYAQIQYFDWAKRWLKGDQYAHILRNIDLYCHKFGFEKFEAKSHPECIYKHPVNGHIYFVKGKGVGSEFGFPRVSEKKKYRWKKMNFTTELPKKNPHVTYVVASAIKSHHQHDKDLPDFRMHAVIPHRKTLSKDSPMPEYILCHVREVEHRALVIGQEVGLETCAGDNWVDFYRLFLCLHNLKIAN